MPAFKLEYAIFLKTPLSKLVANTADGNSFRSTIVCSRKLAIKCTAVEGGYRDSDGGIFGDRADDRTGDKFIITSASLYNGRAPPLARTRGPAPASERDGGVRTMSK
ncbi:hypothetical protein EVAR_81950_1 [Eumeta japonica]|uniref:Uncharacterized protein n=1 Tax=Eumeta variegata TaxID=151549 RepID=A0A4C1ZFS2_EUMVA|nr:hypothetical protein EVAR_81950_1 [Eumeta japonica]